MAVTRRLHANATRRVWIAKARATYAHPRPAKTRPGATTTSHECCAGPARLLLATLSRIQLSPKRRLADAEHSTHFVSIAVKAVERRTYFFRFDATAALFQRQIGVLVDTFEQFGRNDAQPDRR